VTTEHTPQPPAADPPAKPFRLPPYRPDDWELFTGRDGGYWDRTYLGPEKYEGTGGERK